MTSVTPGYCFSNAEAARAAQELKVVEKPTLRLDSLRLSRYCSALLICR